MGGDPGGPRRQEGAQNRVQMKGATAEPWANTSREPSSKTSTTAGPGYHATPEDTTAETEGP